MRPTMIGAVLVLLAGIGAAEANTIRNACLKGERKANPRLCTCIQTAADRTLSRKDQRLAATFFRDPDRAQEIRQSDRRAHEVFWQRYKSFGAFAASICR